MTSRRWLVVAAVVALVALGATAWNLNGAWDARRDAIEARNQARSELADLRTTLAGQRHRLREARRDAARANTERDGANVTVQLRNDQLAATKVSRDDAANSRNAKNAEVVVVRQCIGGANAALDALQRRDTAATITALQLVDAPCRAAQAAQGGPTPRYGFDFPDPYVLVAGAERYTFATNASGGNIQVLHRQADGAWTTAGEALGRFPDWAAWGRTWAPSVLARPGGFVLYYTVRESVTGRQCVSRATSVTPGGPYVDTSTAPLACGSPRGARPGGDRRCRRHARSAVEAPNGRPRSSPSRSPPTGSPSRAPSASCSANQRWEDTNVEAPSMLVAGNGAWLFFSGGNWNGGKYATGVVRSRERPRPV